jgi:hypothetical protein
VVDSILNCIDKNLKSKLNIYLNDKSKALTHLNEDFRKNIYTISLIASMLLIPGITNAKGLINDLQKLSQEENFNISNPKVTQSINKNASIKKTYGSGKYKLTYSNLVNLVATIAYNEGMMDYIVETKDGI